MRPPEPPFPRGSRLGSDRYNVQRRANNDRSSHTSDDREAASSSGQEEIQATQNWERWAELTLRLDALPADVRPADIWEWLSPEGDISWIDIFTSTGHNSDSSRASAKIRFQPPPKRPFWQSGKYVVDHPNRRLYPRGLTIRISRPFEPSSQWTKNSVDSERTYPMHLTLCPKTLEFGVKLEEESMKSMKTVLPNEGHDLALELNMRSKTLTAKFPIPTRDRQRRVVSDFRFTVHVSQMKEVYQTTNDNKRVSLVLPLTLPPRYYCKNEDTRATMSEDLKTWSHNDAWKRVTDVLEDMEAPLRYPIGLNNGIPDPEYVDIGRWTTFRFTFSQSEKDNLLLEQFRYALEDLNIIYKDSPDCKILPKDGEIMWTHLDHPPITQNQSGTLALLESMSKIVHLEFAVRYQLEVCVSRGILNEHTVTVDFLQKLAELDPVKARLRLEFLADRNEPVQEPMSLFSNRDAEAYFANPKIPHYCAMIRKAIITPTTIRFNTPSVETSNRVIRRQNHLQDRFLRIQFMDEEERSKIGRFEQQNDAIYTRLLRTLYQGVQVGDRHYEFLAYGNSQLRECGAYFFCPTGDFSCDEMRKRMGQFDHIKVPAKYASRLGQCFSTTREMRGMGTPQIRQISDIERNGYCFSDGVGKISKFLAKLVVEEMELDIFNEPSAFQFRMGGCKGVLTVWPEAIKAQVLTRQSQEKFKADFNGLEIIRCAKRATATLNRQTITILESLGVPASAFLKLLNDQLRRFERAMDDKRVAVELLTQFVDENQVTLVLAELIRADFIGDDLQEPFVKSVLNLWRSWSLKLLKDKARIHVEKSAFVLGCVDETGSLKGHSTAYEGYKGKDGDKLPHIFLQLSDPKTYNKTEIITGVCIVGRNPSLHPGDIRVVLAVDEPKLHHLKDVVVFPSTGDRPLPNMLSGGDLDGDDFFIIWDNTLLPGEWNYPPMNYSGSKPKELDREVTPDDMRNHFVSYVQNDVLALVAHAHLAHADKFGPKSKECLHLAECHSAAVDFPKTGEPVAWKSAYSPRMWPHWMQKNSKSYHSQKALGQIFDQVCRQSFDFCPNWRNDFDSRILNAFTPDGPTLTEARKIKTQYDISVRRILTQHNVTTEFELWSAFAMSRPAIGSDYKRQEDLGREYDALKQRFREMCYEAAGGHNPQHIDPFVAAMYQVTHEQMKIALFEHNQEPINDGGHITGPQRLEARSMPLISFPWIFPWVMIRIVQGGQHNGKDSMLAAARRQNHAQIYQTVKVDTGTTRASTSETPNCDGGDALAGSSIIQNERENGSRGTVLEQHRAPQGTKIADLFEEVTGPPSFPETSGCMDNSENHVQSHADTDKVIVTEGADVLTFGSYVSVREKQLDAETSSAGLARPNRLHTATKSGGDIGDMSYHNDSGVAIRTADTLVPTQTQSHDTNASQGGNESKVTGSPMATNVDRSSAANRSKFDGDDQGQNSGQNSAVLMACQNERLERTSKTSRAERMAVSQATPSYNEDVLRPTDPVDKDIRVAGVDLQSTLDKDTPGEAYYRASSSEASRPLVRAEELGDENEAAGDRANGLEAARDEDELPMDRWAALGAGI